MNFIFMLTHNDSTVPQRRRGLRGSARHGAALRRLQGHRRDARGARRRRRQGPRRRPRGHARGRVDLARVRARLARGGARHRRRLGHGRHARRRRRADPRRQRHQVLPFPGRIEGHPSVLLGTIAEIAQRRPRLTAHRRRLRPRPARLPQPRRGPIALTRDVVAASAGPVVVAGSIATAEQIRLVAATGAWGFTIGGRHLRGAPARRARPGRPDHRGPCHHGRRRGGPWLGSRTSSRRRRQTLPDRVRDALLGDLYSERLRRRRPAAQRRRAGRALRREPGDDPRGRARPGRGGLPGAPPRHRHLRDGAARGVATR